MTEKKMKSSTIKTVVVECKMKDNIETMEFDVDSDIFDDVLLEASTRFAGERVKRRNAQIAPILTAWEKKDAKDQDKHICYNSYHVVVNAGLYIKAENMRRNFLRASGIDLKTESIKGNGKFR